MPVLGGIGITEVYEVSCADHGVIGTAKNDEGARTMQRQHFEWRHQPDPTDRTCLWRYPVGGARPGYWFCQLPAAHDGLHDNGAGERWAEFCYLPRSEDGR